MADCRADNRHRGVPIVACVRAKWEEGGGGLNSGLHQAQQGRARTHALQSEAGWPVASGGISEHG
jgi:hypothetical protein